MIMNEIYPKFEHGDLSPIYYVEFNRDGKGKFTLFKRQFIYIEGVKSHPLMGIKSGMQEVHPWNVLSSFYGPDGAMPDKNWVKFMVDALNKA